MAVDAVQYCHHISMGSDPTVPYGNPFKGNLKTHGICDELHRTLVRNKRLHISVEFVWLHEIDHVTDSVFEESSQLSFSLLHVFRTRVAACHELTWHNPTAARERNRNGDEENRGIGDYLISHLSASLIIFTI